jgi:drug/metabolite transporter (DMT)-like permease
LTTYTLTIGAVPVLLICLPALLSQDWARVTLAGWAAVVWASIVPVYFAWSVWSWATARVGVARTSVYMYLVPIISGVTSALFLGESFGVQQLLGALLVLGGLALGRRRAVAQPAVPEQEAYARS